MTEIQSFPTHQGTRYIEFMQKLSQDRRTQNYLEIGVRNGLLMSHIYADHAIGVDPIFDLSFNAMKNKKRLELYAETSDIFFRRTDIIDKVGGPFDLVFLDGLHLFEFLLRDFINSEKLCRKNSLIIAHDCLPLNAEMADRDEDIAKQRTAGNFFHGWWTGDVWKFIPILKKFRPDLKLILLDSDPTGLLCITNLDPNNTVLDDHYLEIVHEYFDLGNNFDEMRKHISTEFRSSTTIIENGLDSTIFFRI